MRRGPLAWQARWHPGRREVATLLSEGLCPVHCTPLGTETREPRVKWSCRCFCYGCGLCWSIWGNEGLASASVVRHFGQSSTHVLRLDN